MRRLGAPTADSMAADYTASVVWQTNRCGIARRREHPGQGFVIPAALQGLSQWQMVLRRRPTHRAGIDALLARVLGQIDGVLAHEVARLGSPVA